MTIINYTPKYCADITQLVTEFYDEALKENDGGLDIDTLHKTIEVYKDNSFLLIREDKCIGLIAGLTAHSPINSDKVYQEIVWYVTKSHRRYGVYLLREVEQILKDRGYTSIIMGCMHNSKTDKLFRLYNRLGYKPLETHFRRSLCQK